MASNPEKRIQELHLTLPPAPKPVAKYKTAVLAGNLLHVSGHGPREEIHCHEIRGGLLGCLKVCGIQTRNAEHKACVLKGAPACVFDLTW